MTISKARLAVWLFILSESSFFLILILAFVYYHGEGGGPSARALEPLRAFVFSLFLFASSFTLARASSCLARAEARPARGWLFATLVLGTTFLTGQGFEYRRLLGQNLTLGTNLFGTTFYTLTGFHGFHVLAGLLALASLFCLSFTGDFEGGRLEGFEAVALYWHFVDAVWVVVFALVYIWGPRA